MRACPLLVGPFLRFMLVRFEVSTHNRNSPIYSYDERAFDEPLHQYGIARHGLEKKSYQRGHSLTFGFSPMEFCMCTCNKQQRDQRRCGLIIAELSPLRIRNQLSSSGM